MRLLVRVSDNVLDPENWPVLELEFGRDPDYGLIVIVQRLKNRGDYSVDLLGHTLDQVVEWLAWDPTGCHPEVYHEAYMGAEQEWKSSVSDEDLLAWISRGAFESNKRFILWDVKDDIEPPRARHGIITTDGVLGQLTIDNAYLVAYASYPDDRRPKDLQVGESIRKLGFSLSGSHGWYDLYRVA